MRVSIVIPTLNEADNISRLVEQTRKLAPFEIIVVDGGSSDETVSSARDADLVLTSEPGRAEQQNAGASRASGDIVLFLHADSRLSDHSLKQVCQRMSDGKFVGGCLRQRIDATGLLYRAMSWGNHQRARWLGWAYGDQGIFVRRSVFEELGGFPEVRLMEDLLFVKQLRRAGRFVVADAEICTSARRWQQKGVLRQTLRNWTLLALVHLGVSPNWLARFYPTVR